MARNHFYLLSRLPDAAPFGNKPPVGKQALLSLVRESDGPAELVETVLLCDDLIQREAVLCGEIKPEQADIAVLSLSGSETEPPLPSFLAPPETDSEAAENGAPSVDRIWDRYFYHAAKTAKKTRSRFLALWVAYEVGLRNVLATVRAEALKLDPAFYRVAQDLTDTDIAFDDALKAWSAASNPLEAYEALDKIRWRWISDQAPLYRFNDDEVTAYAAKLMLLIRWDRISKQTEG